MRPAASPIRRRATLLGGIGPRLAGAAFTEYVPALDESGISALVAVRLLAGLIAGMGEASA